MSYDIFSERDLDPDQGGPSAELKGLATWIPLFCISRDSYLRKRLAGLLPRGPNPLRDLADRLADAPAWYWEAFAGVPLHHKCLTCCGSGMTGEILCPDCDGLGHSSPPTDCPSVERPLCAATAPQSGATAQGLSSGQAAPPVSTE